MKLSELFNRIKALDKDLKDIIKDSQIDDYEDLSGLDIDLDDPEDRFLWRELRKMMSHVDDLHKEIRYLSYPVEGEAFMRKNDRGRYESMYQEYKAGYPIEFRYYDESSDRYEWILSTLEHNGKDYYIVGYPDVELEDLKVRIR